MLGEATAFAGSNGLVKGNLGTGRVLSAATRQSRKVGLGNHPHGVHIDIAGRCHFPQLANVLGGPCCVLPRGLSGGVDVNHCPSKRIANDKDGWMASIVEALVPFSHGQGQLLVLEEVGQLHHDIAVGLGAAGVFRVVVAG